MTDNRNDLLFHLGNLKAAVDSSRDAKLKENAGYSMAVIKDFIKRHTAEPMTAEIERKQKELIERYKRLKGQPKSKKVLDEMFDVELDAMELWDIRRRSETQKRLEDAISR